MSASSYSVVMTAPRLAPRAVGLLRDAGCDIHYTPPYPSPELLAGLVAQVRAHAVLSRQGKVDATVLRASDRLRIVARHGVGVDDVDLATAQALGVLVTRAPGSNTGPVAEHTLAMILALAKGLRPLSAAIGAGRWREGDTQVRDIGGMRLGLVGFGAIGRAVARLAEAFGMAVAAFDPAAGGPDLHGLLAGSDVVSLHCPLLPATRRLIDAAALAAMPAGGFLVNTARGGIVDEDALLAALESGHLAGAALDVFEDEPPPPDHPLRRHPLVIATPHVAGVTPAALDRMGVVAAECIVAALTGRPVPPERVVAMP